MAEDIFLMMKDTPVLRVNFDDGTYDVLNESLLPFPMKNRIRNFEPLTGNMNYDVARRAVILGGNRNVLIDFLSQRVLPLSRENAKKIYQLFGFSQIQSEANKAEIALICKAASLQDNYWIKTDKSPLTWSNIDLRTNHLNTVVAQVSLHGNSFSLTGDVPTPELTGQGAYAKAWKREPDGLYLHKRGANGSWESKIEVMVSHLLDKCSVNHLPYVADSSKDEQMGDIVYTCKCKCMTDEDISILSGMDFISWCNVRGIDSFAEALRIDPEAIYQMWIVDYLISNCDRHNLNWGFFYNCNTMQILGCHPLYDHNNAFDLPTMQDPERSYLYDGRMTMRKAAQTAMKKLNEMEKPFYFTEAVTREDFLTDRQYDSFTSRAKELGIPQLSHTHERIER